MLPLERSQFFFLIYIYFNLALVMTAVVYFPLGTCAYTVRCVFAVFFLRNLRSVIFFISVRCVHVKLTPVLKILDIFEEYTTYDFNSGLLYFKLIFLFCGT